MASKLSIIRLILHIASTFLLIFSIGLILAAIFTTAWQVYQDKGQLLEIHQHGLWFDYTFAKRHSAGKGLEPEWHWRYKFGQSVEGDEDHRWKPYQYNSLILFCTGAFLAFVSSIMSYMAPYFISVSLIWAFISIWPAFLTLAGVALFFTQASLPENNYVFVDKRIELEIAYSFYLSIAAAIGFFIALTAVIGAAVADILLLRRGERPSFRETYFRVSTSKSASTAGAASATVQTVTVTEATVSEVHHQSPKKGGQTTSV